MRARPWETLAGLAEAHRWAARVTHAENGEWVSVALRARSPEGRRVVALWRGRDLASAKFTSACTWVEGAHMSPSGPREYFHPISAADLRSLLQRGADGPARMAHGAAGA